MKCSEFENRIYLYEELTVPQKTLLDDHRSHCDACNILAVQFFQSQILIRKISTRKTEVQNSQQLTERIMYSITRDNQVSVFDKVTTYLDSLFVRYAFSAVSILLVGFFLYEQQASNNDSIAKIAKTEVKTGLVLNMSSFRNQYSKQRANKEQLSISRYAYFKSGGFVKTFNQ